MMHSPWRVGQWPWVSLGSGAILVVYTGFIAVLLAANLIYLFSDMAETGASYFTEIFQSADIRYAAWLTLWTSLLSCVLAILFAVPCAYALSRLRIPAKPLFDMLVDTPIILPKIVVGVTLLVFFQTALGRGIQGLGLQFVFAPAGIVLAQFLCVSPYALRTVKSSLDAVDTRLENVSRTLGWSSAQVFWRVTLPMIRNGIVAGGVIAWALAMGLYGPLMVFAGTTRQMTEVLPTSISLELSVGQIGTALAITMVMVFFAMLALLLFKRLVGGQSLW